MSVDLQKRKYVSRLLSNQYMTCTNPSLLPPASFQMHWQALDLSHQLIISTTQTVAKNNKGVVVSAAPTVRVIYIVTQH